VLVLSRTGQHSSRKTWAFAVPLSGPARRLGYGPVGDVAVRDGAVLVGSAMNVEPAEPAQWKGYRGRVGCGVVFTSISCRSASTSSSVIRLRNGR
jgi:tricorn protease